MNLEKFDGFFKAYVNNKELLTEEKNLNKVLKEEIALSREIESSLRFQINKTRDRNIALQRDLNVLKGLAEQKDEQGNQMNLQEEKIKELTQFVAKLQTQINAKISSVTKEIEFGKKIKQLENQIREQDGILQMTKIEQQMALKNKDSTIKLLEENVQNLKNETEQIQLDLNMTKNEFDRVHLTYSKQIMNYEQTIRQYEKDRREILGESPEGGRQAEEKSILKRPKSSIKKLWDKKVNVTWADAVRKFASEESKVQNNEITEEELKRIDADVAMSVISVETQQDIQLADTVEDSRPKFKPKMKSNRNPVATVKPGVATAVVSPLDVFPVRDVSNQQKKKKLYSNNSNHFVF